MPTPKFQYVFKILHYLKFLLNSTNQHGVHSPFIYSYVTKCLYAKSKYPQSKSMNVLLKSIGYFNIKEVNIPENQQAQKIVQEYFPHVNISSRPSKILWVSAYQSKLLVTVLSDENSLMNDSLLLIDGIYSNSRNYTVWRTLKNNKKVRVTVDMYYCGAVFFRKEQAKEHFKIRI